MIRRFSVELLMATIAVLSCACWTSAAEEIDIGRIKDSVYQSQYFGITVVFPSGWNVQDQEARERIMDMGGKAVAGDDPNLNAAIEASESEIACLFAVFQHPLGAPVAYNPNMMCMAERIRHLPGIQRGEDYLFHAKRFLEAGQMQVTFPSGLSTQSLGGREYGILDVEISMAGVRVRQTHYATITKGYALDFILSYTTDDEEEALESIFKSVSFESD